VVEAGQDALLDSRADEDSLVEGARRNDMRAFEQLYRLHSGRIYGLCYRLCNDRETAEDLTQEAFVLAWRKLDSFRGESAFGSWLYRISTNVALSHLRKRKPLMASLEYEEYEQVENISPPEEQMNLEAAISKLPDGARIVFVLYSIEGYSHNEISSTLKIATGSSKAQLHRARQLLQGYLSDGNA
jgi:RNA polymerase sigma-70 factor (ECF subfamily)